MTTVGPLGRDAASLRLVGWLAASWAVLLVIGVVSLRQADALSAGNPVSFSRAVFTSANASTMAGFAQQFARPDDFSRAVRGVLMLQTLSGTLLFLAGGGVLLARVLGLRHRDGRITATALAMIGAAAVVGAVAREGDDTLGTAAARGIAAISNGGVAFGADPHIGTAFSLALVPLSVIGSWGVLVVTDGIDWLARRAKPSAHTVRVLILTAVIYLSGTAVLWLLLKTPGDTHAAALVRADALLWSARGYGLPIDAASTWPPSVMGVVLAVMAIGTGTAGTASAVGVGWLFTVPRRSRQAAGRALILQCMLVSATVLGLTAFAPQLKTAPRSLLAFSGANGLGLSHEPLTIAGGGLLVLAACMVLAKLLPLVILALAVHDRTADKTAAEDVE